MDSENQVRIDKFLWAVRVYKTRGQAADACSRGRVLIGGLPVKPSRTVHIDDIINVRKAPVTFTFKVISVLAHRVGPKLVSQLVEDLTPESEKAKLDIKDKNLSGFRSKGAGRPTKKERRTIDRWFDDMN